MRENKFFKEHALHLASLLGVLALILIIPATATEKKGFGIFLYIMAGLLFIGGGVVLYLSYTQKANKRNYFLYDEKRGMNRSIQSLTLPMIQGGVDRFLGEYAKNVEGLWPEIPKTLRMRLQKFPAFRALLAYRMLLTLTEKTAEEIVRIFTDADERVIGYLCQSIHDGGDAKMADFLFELKQDAEKNSQRIASFFMKNKRAFEERMIRYTELHLHDFDIDPPSDPS